MHFEQTAGSDTVSINQVFSVQLLTDTFDLKQNIACFKRDCDSNIAG